MGQLCVVPAIESEVTEGVEPVRPASFVRVGVVCQ
jgi:hypothetical protein